MSALRVPNLIGWACSLVIAFFGTFGLVVPLAYLVHRGIHDNFFALIGDPSLLFITRFTLWQASLSLFFSILLGLPLGLWVGAVLVQHTRIARWLQLLLVIPYGIPTVVAGYVGIAWLGRSSGVLDWAYSLKAVVLMHALLNIPWVALLVSEARTQIPKNQIEAARMLGATSLSIVRFIIWPSIRWALLSAAAQVFCLCTMSFALVLILGGGPPVQTLETALYSRMRYGSVDLSGAVACAIWELGITLVPWVTLLIAKSQLQKKPILVRNPSIFPQKGHKIFSAKASLVLIACFLPLFPFLSLFKKDMWGILLQSKFLIQIFPSLKISLVLALISGFGAVGVALAGLVSMAWLKKLPLLGTLISILLVLPSGISVLVLGVGFWIAYGSWIDPFEGSMTAMAALQMALFSPVAFRILWPVAQGTQSRLMEAAVTLGAVPCRAFYTVEWPRWKAPLISAFALAVGASLGEVAAVSLFYSENLIPLPLLVTRWMGQYRFEEARAVSAVLFLLSAAVIIGTFWSGQNREVRNHG